MNRWLETDTQKTARNIINVLNESAAGMVKKEINKDKPEEAPKNKKVALEKKVTKAAIKGKKPESKNAKMPKKIAKKVVKEVDNEIMNESEEIKVKKKVFTESTYLNENEKLYLGRKAEVKRDIEDTDLHRGDIVTIDSVEVDVDGWDSDYVNVTRESDGKEFSGVSSYELNLLIDEGCGNKIVKEELEPEVGNSIEDQIADLQDYLDNTPEVSDEERAEIQAEIDSLISQLGEKEVDNKIMNESAPGTDAYDKLVQGDDVYFRNEEGAALLGHYADNYPEPEEYDEGFKPEYGGTEEGLQKAKEAAANGDVWEFMEVFEDTLQPMNEVYAYVYGQDDLMEMLKTLRQVNVVKKLEENQIEDARKDSIEKGLLSEAVFEIDYADDDVDLSTEESVIEDVRNWLGTLANEVKIEVPELSGPAGGWPIVRLTGNKEKIAKFLLDNYNSGGEETLDDVYDLYLQENKLQEASFSDKVSAIKKSLKKKDKRLSNKTAEKSAKNIAGAMAKKESLEQNEEDGWGEDVLEICEPFFEKVERTMYEVRNARRGSYAHFGDTVSDLAAWMGELSTEAEDVQSELDDMKEQLQESDNEPLKEEFFNLYSDFDSLYGISKYSPKELKEFINSLIDLHRISEKDAKIMLDFADKYQKLIDETGYESTVHLKESYSDKLGGDPSDFVTDVETIKAKLSEIDTSGFGSRLAVQMVEDWIETCDYQIEKGKRLASGNEFYTEADNRTYKDRDEAEYYRNKELYANSNLARHREAMMAAKKACKEKGIKLDESDLPKLKMKPRNDDGKNHKKIDIYVDGKYFCSTTAHKTVKDAVASVKSEYPELEGRKVKGNLAESEEAKPIAEAEVNYLSRTRKEEPLDLVAYEPEITSIDEVKDKYVKIRGDFHRVIDVKPEGDKFVISFAAGTGTAIGGEFEPATLDEIKRLQLYTENK